MKRHPVYDQWGQWQKIPTAIFGVAGMLLFLGYLFGYLIDPKWGIIGCLLVAAVASTQRCGHLALRLNDLEDRLAQIESAKNAAN